MIYNKTFLPITKDELAARGWNYVDIVLVTGDAYIDHPAFGAAVLGRVLEAEGYRVAILPQPNWQDDLRDFKKFGKPRLFFGVSAGAMDSMVNHYTALKRLRSTDAYTPDNKAGFRPNYPTVVYTQILKKLYPDVPVVLGGIEASMRRLTHYDYWQDKVMPSVLIQSGADLLVYGMGERAIVQIAKQIESCKFQVSSFKLDAIPQTAYLTDNLQCESETCLKLPSHNECLANKRKFAEAFKLFEEETNKINQRTIIQDYSTDIQVIVHPPYPLPSQEECDRIYDLPYTRKPHPKYKKRGEIPAYTMIRHSVNIHRGCFGGCSFCAINAHQGKHIVSRSEKSILKEIENVCQMDDFKGYISDVGGPSANMYAMRGKDEKICENCKKPSCIFPKICQNLYVSHKELLQLYKKIAKNQKIKKFFVTSGIRYDLFDEKSNYPDKIYAEYLIKNCVSGRLKVAPEHSEKHVLDLIRKPDFEKYENFRRFFDHCNRKFGLHQRLIPYFISSLPGCTQKDMQNLHNKLKEMGYKPEQVQDFTPTPMTLATTMFYTGMNPYTGERIFVERNLSSKKSQFGKFL
ncbi:MAG: YgiQ family radical SAM protein [Bacteroidales bacterium]|nr:YgiQ family radical SAM protein [Bacteroidales bacterium]